MKRDGQLLWAGRPHARLAPASLTKLMTALLVLEGGHLEDTVTVSRAAARETGTRLGLRAGQQLVARDLLAAMVVRSANDACRALADHAGPDFAARMNRRAEALGLADTHFVEPCGHDRPGQYSSAADMARLAEEALRHDEFASLARTRSGTIATLDGRHRFRFASTNALLGRYPGALGIKTGSTDAAGHCIVALAERSGVRVLLVLLHARDRWWNAAGLLDRAFEAKPPL